MLVSLLVDNAASIFCRVGEMSCRSSGCGSSSLLPKDTYICCQFNNENTIASSLIVVHCCINHFYQSLWLKVPKQTYARTNMENGQGKEHKIWTKLKPET